MPGVTEVVIIILPQCFFPQGPCTSLPFQFSQVYLEYCCIWALKGIMCMVFTLGSGQRAGAREIEGWCSPAAVSTTQQSGEGNSLQCCLELGQISWVVWCLHSLPTECGSLREGSVILLGVVISGAAAIPGGWIAEGYLPPSVSPSNCVKSFLKWGSGWCLTWCSSLSSHPASSGEKQLALLWSVL